jgi:hypothetical protein
LPKTPSTLCSHIRDVFRVGPSIETRVGSLPIFLKELRFHGFNHSVSWTAKVRNASSWRPTPALVKTAAIASDVVEERRRSASTFE